MRPAPRLSNCYAPVRKNDISTASSTRNDSRANHELRPLKLQSHLLPNADGSALVELGHTKVICRVTGPTTKLKNVECNVETGVLDVQVQYRSQTGYPEAAILAQAPTPLDENYRTYRTVNQFIDNRQKNIGTKILESISPALPLSPYPKCAIQLNFCVLQDDGNVLGACLAAANLALVDAGMELYDLVCSCSVVSCPNNGNSERLVADPTASEWQSSSAVVELAMMANWNESTYLSQKGTMSNEALSLARDGCRTMHRFLKQHLLTS